MDVVEEYLKNLKRFDDAARYFETLSDEEYQNLENTKIWDAYIQIYKNVCRLYPLAKAQGCNKIYYYDE